MRLDTEVLSLFLLRLNRKKRGNNMKGKKELIFTFVIVISVLLIVCTTKEYISDITLETSPIELIRSFIAFLGIGILSIFRLT